MVNILEFDMLHEYKFAWNVSARACYTIFDNLDDCMMIYKYKLSNHDFIATKFGCSNPERIDFNKLDGRNLFLFHLDMYNSDAERLRELVEFCIDSNIDFWMPVSDSNKNLWLEDDKFYDQIKSIATSYHHNYYDLTDIKYVNENSVYFEIKNKIKPVIRDIKIKNIFD